MRILRCFQPGPCDLEPIFDVFVEAIKLNKDPRNTSLPPVKELLCTCLGVQPTLKPNHFLRIPKKVLILGSGGRYSTLYL